MIDGFSLSFFFPLVVHALAGLMTGILGGVTFRTPKYAGRHLNWGMRYLWAYTLVFVTAALLSVQHWSTDGYLFLLAAIGYGFALSGYGVRRFRKEILVRCVVGKHWVIAHIVGMIGSYVVLWTAFYVDNAHLIPLLNRLPPFTFWILPILIALPFVVVSIARFLPKTVRGMRLDSASKG